MNYSRLIVGYLVAPLAASTVAALVLVLEDSGGISFLLPMIAVFYVIAFVLVIPVGFVITFLPTRSLVIYIIVGLAVGVALAPTLRPPDLSLHGQLLTVSMIVWQAIRVALAGGAGLAVFWYFVVRSPAGTPAPAVPVLAPSRKLAEDAAHGMAPAKPKTVGEIETFITMLRTACENDGVYQRLERLLSMPDEKRQTLVRAWVNDLLIAEAPRDFVNAIACLLDDQVAEKAYETIFRCKRGERS